MEIDRNIPIPQNRRARSVYPWVNMTVGDSFKVPDGKREAVRVAAAMFAKRHLGCRFLVAADDNGNMRCWRVA